MRNAKVFCGSSHHELGDLILNKLGLNSSPLNVSRHSNHELSIELGVSVRNQDIFIIQSGSDSVNDHLMELLCAISACRSCDAWRITAVMPYLPYSKQCKRKNSSRGPITAKLVANMLAVAGVDHIITIDLHHDQMQGFFNQPVDNLLAEPTLCRYVTENFLDYKTSVAVAKNPGGIPRVTSFADRLKIEFAVIHGAASCPGPLNNKVTILAESMDLLESTQTQWEEGLHLIGNVELKTCFLVDDIIDKPDSFIAAANLLMKKGAKRVICMGTHGILGSDAMECLQDCLSIEAIVVTNSYPIDSSKKLSKLQIIDISSVLAEAIRRTHNSESISYLFNTSI